MKNTKKLATIALLIVLAAATLLATLPLTTAQDLPPFNTWAICDVTPNPVGVNQEVLVILGITQQASWPQPGWEGLTVTIVKPDGQTETLGPIRTDTTGLTGTNYVPTQVGTYTFQTNFPEQVATADNDRAGIPAGTVMKASKSDVIPVIVQQEPIEYYPPRSLPTEYWTRPIDAQNREWWSISGSWLARPANRFAPNNDGPETAHMLWTKPLAEGGLVGGDMGELSIETGDAYEGHFTNPFIVGGILIGPRYSGRFGPGAETDLVEQTVFAIDLRTGEELWERVLLNNELISFGQTMYWDTFNMHGVFSYIWATQGSTWMAFDPFTGRWEYNITKVPGGSNMYGPEGEIIRYTVNLRNGWMTKWNSTRAYQQTLIEEGAATSTIASWRPTGRVIDGTLGIQWNVTIPTNLEGGVERVLEDRILGSNTEWAGGAQQPNPKFWAISLKPGQEGQLIFNTPWQLPEQGLHVDFPGSHPYSLEDGVFVITAKETRQHWGLSLETGLQLWGPTTHFEPYMNSFSNIYFDPWGQSLCAYGKLYTAGMGGVVNAYNVNTGIHLWEYKLDDQYAEILWGNNWPGPLTFITDGKIYVFHMEHSVINPLPRGAPGVCLDAETGEEIWRIDGLRLGTRWGGQPIIGDSVIAAFSSYDNSIVAIGKGPSAITVAAPDVAAPLGTPIVIQGMVTDVSPGTTYYDQAARFPSGVPAISDADQSEWMLYVYQQQPMPENAMGVPVKLTAVDSNGNTANIGTATSDASGQYSFMWTPPAEGLYTIMANFEGSDAFYGSQAQTAVGVSAAPAPQPSPTPTPTPSPSPSPLPSPGPGEPAAPINMYLIAAAVAVVAVIVVAAIFLRRRK